MVESLENSDSGLGGSCSDSPMWDSPMWDSLIDEETRRQFESDWARGHPRVISDYLHFLSPEKLLPTLEELVCIELELTWKNGCSAVSTSAGQVAGVVQMGLGETGGMLACDNQPPLVEHYLQQFPQLGRTEVLVRLFRQECLVRREFASSPEPEEYLRRFAQLSLPEHLLWASASPEALSKVAFGETAANQASPAKQTLPASRLPASTLPVQSSPGDLPTNGPSIFPCRFGGYELLGQLGRGGMGVVYRARQLSADRVVALKVIRGDQLSLDCVVEARLQTPRGAGDLTATATLERFRTEARAAARLDHENIVTVYDVGEVEGRPYFSMKFVEGQSLSEMLRDGPLENRRAATYAHQVALALTAAHHAGVLHRDLKPQNVLVERQTDRALVADFGLAKLTAVNDQLTHTGEILGTPCYMSPEQAGQHRDVGEATDIYSLGATLYHLLTGRPPFQAATVLETIWQVVQRPPVAPRQLNPAVACDLETICLKALEKLPHRRYPSAEALAEDLRRFLTGQPIRARRISPLGRLALWIRYNPWLAGLAGTAMASLVVALIASVIGYWGTSRALGISQANLRQAQATIQDLLIEVSEEELLNQPGMQPLRERLLRKALGGYRHLIENNPADELSQEELAEVHFRMASIHSLIGDFEEALRQYELAGLLQEALYQEQPEHVARLSALATTWNARGNALARRERFAEASQAYHEALRLRRRLVSLAPEQAEFGRHLANTMMNLGLLARGDDFGQAAEWMGKAQDLRRELRAKFPSHRMLLVDLGKGSYNLAMLAEQTGHLEQAIEHLRLAVTFFDQTLQAEPQDQAGRLRLALSHRRLGEWLSAQGHPEEADGHFRASQTEAHKLASQNPQVLEYQAELAVSHRVLAESAAQSQQVDRALDHLARAGQLLRWIQSERSPSAKDRLEWARVQGLTGTCQYLQGNLANAEATLQETLQLIEAEAQQGGADFHLQELKEETRQMLKWIENQLANPPKPSSEPSLP